MEKEFSIELSQQQAEFLNTLMPNGNSVQIFEKYERRKKAEKKLDDMYVAEFSLRPVKKIKKENDHQKEKNQHNLDRTGRKQVGQSEKQKSFHNNNGKTQKHHDIKQKQLTHVQKQKVQVSKQKQNQQTEFRSSRSQRVSRPTQAYMQFQSQTFKRKFIEKDQPKVSHVQVSPRMSGIEKSKNINAQSNKASYPLIKDNLIELKSIIAEKIQKKVQQKCQLLPTKKNQQTKQISNEDQNLQQQQNGNKNIIDNSKNQHTQQQNYHQLKKKQKLNQQLNQQIIQTIVTKRYPIEQKLQQRINQPKHNLLLTVLSEKFQQLKQMPQTRRSVQKQSQQIKQTSQKQIIKKKQPIQNEKLTNKTIDKSTDISTIRIKNLQKVIYNLSIKQPTLTRSWRILQKLKLHKSSWPFRYPVDPISQGVPDYFDKIKHPMDLRTIQKKLKSQKYQSQQQFFYDVELLLKNSYTYNPQSSNYYKLTNQLQTFFNQLKAKSYIPKSSSGRSYGSSRKASQLNQQQQEEEQEEQENYKSDEIEEQQLQEEQLLQGSGSNKKKGLEMQERNNDNSAKRKSFNNNKNEPTQLTTVKRQRQLYEMEKNKLLQKKLRPISKVIATNDRQGKRVQKQLIDDNQFKTKYDRKQPLVVIGSDDNKINNDNNTNNNQQSQIQSPKQKQKQPPTTDNKSKVQNKKTKNNRIGYNQQQQWQLIPIINRQHLLYDILHLKQPQSQQQLYQFIINNQMLYKQLLFVVDDGDSQQLIRDKQGQQHKVKSQQQQQQQHCQQQLQFQLANLDIYGYKILHTQVNRLIKLQQQQQQRNQLSTYIQHQKQQQQHQQLSQLQYQLQQ